MQDNNIKTKFGVLLRLPNTILVCFLTLIIATPVAHASERPKWVTSHPKSSAAQKFYVGRGESQDSGTEANQNARADAISQMIRENYGFTTKLDTEAIQNETDLSFFKQVLESSGEVRVDGFELQDSYEETKPTLIEAWVIYKLDLRKFEAARSAYTSGNPKVTPLFEIVGSDSTWIEFKTSPPLAEVYVDDVRLGKTPLKLKGILEVGQHNIRLELFGYKKIERQISYRQGFNQSIDSILQPAVGYFVFKDVPDEVTIRVNHQVIKRSQYEKLRVRAGKEHTVEFISSVFEPVTLTAVVGDEEEVPVGPSSFTRKPAFIHVESKGDAARVYLDDHFVGMTPLKNLRVESGKKVLKLERDDSETWSQEILLRPYQNLRIAHKLQLLQSANTTARNLASNGDTYFSAVSGDVLRLNFGIFIGYKTSSFKQDPVTNYMPLGISSELVFWKIGIEGKLGYNIPADDSYYDNNYSQYKLSTRSVMNEVNLNFYLFAHGMYASIGVGHESTSYSSTCNDTYYLDPPCVEMPDTKAEQDYSTTGIGFRGSSEQANYWIKGELKRYESHGGITGKSVFALNVGFNWGLFR